MQDGRVKSKDLGDLGPAEAESILEQPRFRLFIMCNLMLFLRHYEVFIL